MGCTLFSLTTVDLYFYSNFAYITVEELAELRRKGEVIYEGIDRDDKGKVVKVNKRLISF